MNFFVMCETARDEAFKYHVFEILVQSHTAAVESRY